MTVSAEMEGLLADVMENPADDTPRLIFADWCEDNGDLARANFIRRQIADPMNGLTISANVYWDRHQGRLYPWAHVEGFNVGTRAVWVVNRGFICEVHCSLKEWWALGQVICARHPIVRVNMTCRKPARLGNGNFDWSYFKASAVSFEDTIFQHPCALFEVIYELTWQKDRIGWPTEQLAIDAMNAAALKWAKGG